MSEGSGVPAEHGLDRAYGSYEALLEDSEVDGGRHRAAEQPRPRTDVAGALRRQHVSARSPAPADRERSRRHRRRCGAGVGAGGRRSCTGRTHRPALARKPSRLAGAGGSSLIKRGSFSFPFVHQNERPPERGPVRGRADGDVGCDLHQREFSRRVAGELERGVCKQAARSLGSTRPSTGGCFSPTTSSPRSTCRLRRAEL